MSKTAESVIAAFRREQRVNLLFGIAIVVGVFAGTGLGLSLAM